VFVIFLCSILFRLYKQITTEFYLLDYEQNKPIKDLKNVSDNDESQPSCWRRIFIANELTKLFTIR